MVRACIAVGALWLCACGEEERLQSVGTSAPAAKTNTAPATPPYSVAHPVVVPPVAEAAPTVALPSALPRVIPREWLTADPSPVYIFGNDNTPAPPQIVTLTNRGSDIVTVTASLSGDATLTLLAPLQNASLAPGAYLQVLVAFAPTGHDKVGAKLSVTDSAGAAFDIPVAAEQLKN